MFSKWTLRFYHLFDYMYQNQTISPIRKKKLDPAKYQKMDIRKMNPP